MGRIVVGVDGSPPGNRALQWAGAEAKLRRATLEAVCAYHVPPSWFGAGDGVSTVLAVPVAVDELEHHARAVLERSVDEVLGNDPTTEVRKTVVMGEPADVLIEASKDADLLVVGNRGHRDLSGVLLGSVGMYCVHHAACPVVVVRTPKGP